MRLCLPVRSRFSEPHIKAVVGTAKRVVVHSLSIVTTKAAVYCSYLQCWPSTSLGHIPKLSLLPWQPIWLRLWSTDATQGGLINLQMAAQTLELQDMSNKLDFPSVNKARNGGISMLHWASSWQPNLPRHCQPWATTVTLRAELHTPPLTAKNPGNFASFASMPSGVHLSKYACHHVPGHSSPVTVPPLWPHPPMLI